MLDSLFLFLFGFNAVLSCFGFCSIARTSSVRLLLGSCISSTLSRLAFSCGRLPRPPSKHVSLSLRTAWYLSPKSDVFSRYHSRFVPAPFSNFLNHPRGKPTIKPMTNNDTINTTGSARDTQTQASLSSRPPSCLSDPPPSLSRGIASPGISPPPCKTSWGSRQSILKRELWRGTRR